MIGYQNDRVYQMPSIRNENQVIPKAPYCETSETWGTTRRFYKLLWGRGQRTKTKPNTGNAWTSRYQMALDITKANLETSQQKNACKVLKGNDQHRTLYTGQQVIKCEGRKKLLQAWKATRMRLLKNVLHAKIGAIPWEGKHGNVGNWNCNTEWGHQGIPGIYLITERQITSNICDKQIPNIVE